MDVRKVQDMRKNVEHQYITEDSKTRIYAPAVMNTESINRLVLCGGVQMKGTEKGHTAPYIRETCRKHGKILQ